MKKLETILEIYDLKDEKRTGWQLRNIEKPESVAGHSWGTAFLAINYIPDDLDNEKVLKLAIIHDIGEAEIGDIAKRAVDVEQEIDAEEKEKLERKAIEDYSKELGIEISKIWQEYDKRSTDEAKFVKDMDLIDMCLQALKYEKDQRYNPEEDNDNFQKYDGLDEFFATTEGRLNTEIGRQIFDEVKTRYEEVKDSGNN